MCSSRIYHENHTLCLATTAYSSLFKEYESKKLFFFATHRWFKACSHRRGRKFKYLGTSVLSGGMVVRSYVSRRGPALRAVRARGLW